MTSHQDFDFDTNQMLKFRNDFDSKYKIHSSLPTARSQTKLCRFHFNKLNLRCIPFHSISFQSVSDKNYYAAIYNDTPC